MARTTTPRRRRATVAKAFDMGATDAQLLVGTLADNNADGTQDNEIYWELFRKHPWIRACVRIIANAVSQEGFSVSAIDGDDAQSVDDPREKEIREFFRLAFAPKTFRQAIKSLAVDLKIFGFGYWRKNCSGRLLTNLERMDPRLIVPRLNADSTAIDHYDVRRNQLAGTGIIVEQAGSKQIPAGEIIRFSLDEGGDVVFGSPSPLEALDLTTSMDLNIRRHRNSFFRNGATVGNVLINKDADEDAIKSAMKVFQSMKVGVTSAYSNLILPGDWEIKSLMQSGKNDVDFVKATEIVRDEICAVYSVPVSKLLDVSGSMGQAGKGEDDETFEQECVLPLEELIYEKMTVEILQKEFDIDDLELVPRRRNALRYDRIMSAINGVKMGMTGNEARSLVGLAASDAPGMDTPLFIGATAQGVISDEPVNPQPEQNQQISSATDEQQDQQDEVAGKASRRFRYL